jgi:exodeoxyribonuclease-5
MFFIVDEASMIAHDIAGTSIFGTGNLLDDLLKFVYGGQNCRLVLVGDTAQLPPVGRDESPAFDRPRLEVHVQETAECELTEVVRQSHESGILHNATVVRRLIAEKRQELPRLETDMFADVKRISGEDLIETIADAYDKYGIDETAIVCRSNRLANRYNQGIRSRILYREEELVPGDFLMAVRNNYYWINDAENVNFIANGDIVRIIRIRRHIERYGFRFVEADLCLPDYNDLEFTAMVMLDALYSETASIDDEQSRQLYRSVAEDYAHVKPKAMQYKKIGENQFLNALQVKFAYAVTCHKAQGGQWQCVFIDQGRFAAETPDVGYLRWLYTAITRTAEKLYLVNFPEKFFEK